MKKKVTTFAFPPPRRVIFATKSALLLVTWQIFILVLRIRFSTLRISIPHLVDYLIDHFSKLLDFVIPGYLPASRPMSSTNGTQPGGRTGFNEYWTCGLCWGWTKLNWKIKCGRKRLSRVLVNAPWFGSNSSIKQRVTVRDTAAVNTRL